MSITLDHIKEQMQKAYVRAIVGRAGASCSEPSPDYGHDLIVQAVAKLPNGRLSAKNDKLFFCQLKATITADKNETDLIYDMNAEDYNSFLESGDALRILVVFDMPKNEYEWIDVNEDRLLMRYCCYWKVVDGEITTNTSTIRIKIPRHQMFTPDVVNQLLQYSRNRISDGI